MATNELPRPNNQALSWFYGEHKKGNLVIRPYYQRNLIWSLGQKCFLIDSILAGYPLPQVYLNVVVQLDNGGRHTEFQVVDGQQRLNSIIEFMSDEWALVGTAAKAYPVSDIYKLQLGKKYSELPPSLQNRIWNYPLVVQELRDWDKPRIRDLFRRLNYVVERLNNQELRHSQFFGEFAETVEKLAHEIVWDELGIFSRKDSTRMKDVEFTSELLILSMDGIQDQQRSIDKFYADYDISFPNKSKIVRKFVATLESLRTIANLIRNSRFSKKADFYGLFAAVSDGVTLSGKSIDLSPAENKLRRLDASLKTDPKNFTGQVLTYYGTVVEGPNKLAKRKERTRILSKLISA